MECRLLSWLPVKVLGGGKQRTSARDDTQYSVCVARLRTAQVCYTQSLSGMAEQVHQSSL